MATSDYSSKKQCSKCGISKPLTVEYFYKYKTSPDGFMGVCKECKKAYASQWRENNREQHRDYSRRYYHTHKPERQRYHRNYRQKKGAVLRIKNKAYAEKNKDRKRLTDREYQKKNRDKVNRNGRNYYQRHLEEERARSRQKYQNPVYKAKRRIYGREHQIKNRQQKTEYARKYRSIYPDRVSIIVERRRARKLNLPDNLTYAEWEFCLAFFEHKCPVCGCCDRLEKDHYIPLSNPNCIGTVALNIIPLCRSCNASKSDNDPVEWITYRCKEDASSVLDKIERYFRLIADDKPNGQANR
jgi:hypothetical protein